MKFKAGDVVMCVEASDCLEIEEGKIYIVEYAYLFGTEFVHLENGEVAGWFATRFVKIGRL